MNCRKVVQVGLVLTFGVSVLCLARGPDRATGQPAKGEESRYASERPVAEEGEFARLNAVLLDDGYWAIAGVVGLSKDAEGRTVIDVNKDGDFDRDMVLTLPVRVVELDTGEVVPAGIAGVSVADDTFTLVMDDAPVGSVASTAYNGCEGVLVEGKYKCVRTTCARACEKQGEPGGLVVCDCPPDPQ